MTRVGKSGASPLDYGYFVIALEWQPELLRRACPDGRWPNPLLVQQLSSDSGHYAQTHLTLHGLWPDYDLQSSFAAQGYGWPQWCNTCLANVSAVCTDYSSCERYHDAPHCLPSQATTAAFNTSQRWQRYAPTYAWGTAAAHEWAKHGTCSAWYDDDAAYFDAAAAAYYHVMARRGASLVQAGASVPRAMLAEAFATGTSAAPAMRCSHTCSLEEVWIGLAKRPTDGFVDLGTGVDLGASDSCAACEQIRVAEWSGCGADRDGRLLVPLILAVVALCGCAGLVRLVRRARRGLSGKRSHTRFDDRSSGTQMGPRSVSEVSVTE